TPLQPSTARLANAARLLAERRRLKLHELAEKAGEFQQLMKGEKTSLADLAAWLNQELVPGWTTQEEFAAMMGGKKLLESLPQVDLVDDLPSGPLCFSEPSWAAELEKSIVDLDRPARETVLSLQHQLRDFATNRNITLVCDFNKAGTLEGWDFSF